MVESLLTDDLKLTLQGVKARSTATVTEIESSWLHQAEMRLDAEFYNPAIMSARRKLHASGLKLRKLGDVTERIFIPPRFKRVYVDRKYGVPFLQGTHLPQIRPTDLKYLSRSAHKKLERWIIESGWVLVTCSGTIGRVAIALKQWNGWAASQHILRIVPKSNGICPPGYIYSWLTSPLGQVQFNGVYGAVVDEITAGHVENIIIPIPQTPQQQDIVDSINNLAVRSIESKELALSQDALAVDMVESLLTGDTKPTLKTAQSRSKVAVAEIESNWLHQGEMRLDAGYYNQDVMSVRRKLYSSGLVLRKLGDVTERIFMPPRFKRVYVTREHGVPFLQGTHLPQLKPADVKYLSRSAHKNLGRLRIAPRWILVTRSGTIGRIAIGLRQWNGWTASEHIIRIVPEPDSACPPGYIYSWLASPYGQVQFNGIYGAVVDEITTGHIENILIPVPQTPQQKKVVDSINQIAIQAVETRERALEQDSSAIDMVDQLIN